MEEVQRLLRKAGCEATGTDEDESVLYPGQLRFCVLERAAERMLGEEAWKLLGMDREAHAEEARVQRLCECFSLLGLPSDEENIRGSGTRPERLAYLTHILRISSKSSELQDPRAEAEAAASNSAILSAAAGMQSAIFAMGVDLLPPDVKHAAESFSGEALDAEGLRAAVAEALHRARELDEQLEHDEGGPNGEEAPPLPTWAEAEQDLKSSLAEFHDAAREFTDLFASDLSSWADAIPKPELHGLGPAATRTLRKYRTLRTALDGVRAVRQAHDALAGDLGPGKQLWIAELQQIAAESARLLEAQVTTAANPIEA